MFKPVSFLSWEAGSQLVQTEVDIIPSWTDTREATIPDEPIEDGSVINDHIAKMPELLEVVAHVTQTPMYGGAARPLERSIRKSQFQPGGLLAITQAVGSAISAGLSAIGIGQNETSGFTTRQHDEFSDPANEFQDKLIDCYENGYLTTLSIGVNRNSMRTYEGYAIQRFTKVHTTDQGEAAMFQISLKKLNIKKTESAELSIPTAIPEATKLKLPNVAGKKPPTVRDDEGEKEKRKTLLKGLMGGLYE